ncbi:MAG: glycosyl hydrolase family 39, partial [Xanthomonadaceae bacterium]|nr:glycosyl hydrolase family 39 [Xanthomonadaceae bacterium]
MNVSKVSKRLASCLASLALLIVTPLAAAAPPPQVAHLKVDATALGTPFPHFWERMFGSGRAVLSLRDDYRRDLDTVHRATGFEYVRFHGILD